MFHTSIFKSGSILLARSKVQSIVNKWNRAVYLCQIFQFIFCMLITERPVFFSLTYEKKRANTLDFLKLKSQERKINSIEKCLSRIL